MADFQSAYLLVAQAEGGYQKHPNDRGNYNSLGELVGTNLGIAAFTYESWINRPPSEEDMRAITQDVARAIYKAKFWDTIMGGQIESQAVANIFFDGRVNHGGTGTKIMQRVLGVADDGIVGPITLEAINSANPEQLVHDYREARREFYHYLVERTPSFGVFLQGWLNRLSTFTSSPTGMIATVSTPILLGALFLILNS